MLSFILSAISAFIHFFFPSRRYTFVGRLYGHQDSIQIVKATTSIGGTVLLASVGKDGVRLFKLPSMARLPSPDPKQTRRGSVTALTWGSDARHGTDYLVFGTSLGFLVIWRRSNVPVGSHEFQEFQEVYSRSLGHGGEIVSIEVNMSVEKVIRILNCTRDGNVQSWDFDLHGNMTDIFSICLDKMIPRVVQPMRFQGGAERIFVLAHGAEEPGKGVLITLECEFGGIIDTSNVSGSGEISSCATFSEAGQVMAIDNGETGFDLCDIGRCSVIRHFPVHNNATNVRLPTQVAFAEGAKLLVGGSDHGVAYVFDRRTGSLVDTLYHALDGDSFVQTVSAFDSNESTYILTANSSRTLRPYIGVWKFERDTNTRSSGGFIHLVMTVLHKIFQFVMIVTFAAFLSQNLGYYNRVRVFVHDMTADSDERPGRGSYTTVDITVFKTVTAAPQQEHTSSPDQYHENKRAYTAVIEEIFDDDLEEYDEIDESEVDRLLTL